MKQSIQNENKFKVYFKQTILHFTPPKFTQIVAPYRATEPADVLHRKKLTYKLIFMSSGNHRY